MGKSDIKKILRRLLIPAAALICVIGCQTVSVNQRIQDADERVFAAEHSGGESCAPMAMAAAKKKLEKAKELAKSSKTVEDAKVAAIAAKYLAEKAIDISNRAGSKCKPEIDETPATPAAQNR